MCMYHSFFIHSSVHGHLCYLHVLALVKSAAVDIGVPASLSVMAFSGCMSSGGTAGSHGGSIFSF